MAGRKKKRGAKSIRRRRAKKTNRLPSGVYIGGRNHAFLLFSKEGKYLGFSTDKKKVKDAAKVIRGQVTEYVKN